MSEDGVNGPDSYEILDYLDRKLKVGKLDSALLFLSSSSGLLFTFLQALTTPNERFALFLPVILLGWLLPVYYGYILGAVLRDSAIDRLRGWIFLVAGLGGYLWIIVAQWLGRIVDAGNLAPYFPGLVTIPIIVLVAAHRHSFRDLVFKTVGETFSVTASKSAWPCVVAAFLFAVALSALPVSPDLASGTVFATYFGGIGLVYLRRSNYFATRIRQVPSLVSFSARFPERKIPQWATTSLLLGTVVFGLLSLVLWVSFSEPFLAALFGFIALLMATLLRSVDRLFGVRVIIRYDNQRPGKARANFSKLKSRFTQIPRSFLLLLKKSIRRSWGQLSKGSGLGSWLTRHRKVSRSLGWLRRWDSIAALALIAIFVLPPLNYLGTNSQRALDVAIETPPGFTKESLNVSETSFYFDTVAGVGQVQIRYSAAWFPVNFHMTFPFEVRNLRADVGNITRYGVSAERGYWFVSVVDQSVGIPFNLWFRFSDIMYRNLWKATVTVSMPNPSPIPEITNAFSIIFRSQTINVGVVYPDGLTLDADTFPPPLNSFRPSNFYGLNWVSWTINQPPSGGGYRSIRLSLMTQSFNLAVPFPLPLALKDLFIPVVSFMLGSSVQSFRVRREIGSFKKVDP